jgi:predicted nucleic acid-binding protein
MRKRVLDSSILINYWHLRRRKPLEKVRVEDVEAWASDLVTLYDTDAIVTPVYVEVVAGVTSAHELELARAYLAQFRVIDGGQVLASDWLEARRIAERIPRDRRRRQLGDCLIRAIANRFNYTVETSETRFPQ